MFMATAVIRPKIAAIMATRIHARTSKPAIFEYELDVS
jgi:hypothetical protein